MIIARLVSRFTLGTPFVTNWDLVFTNSVLHGFNQEDALLLGTAVSTHGYVTNASIAPAVVPAINELMGFSLVLGFDADAIVVSATKCVQRRVQRGRKRQRA